jgi:stage III sporulation protein SpoIIIAA
LQEQITDDLNALLDVLPEKVRQNLVLNGRKDQLLEVILDLGRVPTARYTDTELVLDGKEVTASEHRTGIGRQRGHRVRDWRGRQPDWRI